MPSQTDSKTSQHPYSLDVFAWLLAVALIVVGLSLVPSKKNPDGTAAPAPFSAVKKILKKNSERRPAEAQSVVRPVAAPAIPTTKKNSR